MCHIPFWRVSLEKYKNILTALTVVMTVLEKSCGLYMYVYGRSGMCEMCGRAVVLGGVVTQASSEAAQNSQMLFSYVKKKRQRQRQQPYLNVGARCIRGEA
jgi:hypothetical protein